MLNLTCVRRYATGKAPYLAIPVWSLERNRYIPATFDRRILQAAVSCPHVTMAHYDETAHRLVLNGTTRASYRLINLSTTTPQYMISENNRRWAQSQRKRTVTMATTPELRKAAKWRSEVAKLERKRDNIRAHAPRSPLLPRLYSTADYWRDSEAQWRAEKPMRRVLGHLAHRERKTWREFYEAVGKMLGREIDSGYKHDRVCHRKHGPSVVGYLNQLPKYIGMTRKPYRSDAHILKPDDFIEHRAAQIEYLTTLSEIRAITDAIEAHKVHIAELEQVTPQTLRGELSEV